MYFPIKLLAFEIQFDWQLFYSNLRNIFSIEINQNWFQNQVAWEVKSKKITVLNLGEISDFWFNKLLGV